METWTLGPETTELSPDEVHIWRGYLDQGNEMIPQLWRNLSRHEKERASRFHFQEHKHRFVVSHGMLRNVLRRYRSLAPDQLLFVTTPHGKPELVREDGESRLQFSLSHSHLMALFAVSLRRRVGVDVEHLRPIADWQSIADRFFSPQERRWLDALSDDKKVLAFLTCWTRKEAYVKARGEGLSTPMASFSVFISAKQPVNLDEPRYSTDASAWLLQDLHLGDQYVGALAVEGYQSRLSCWNWIIS